MERLQTERRNTRENGRPVGNAGMGTDVEFRFYSGDFIVCGLIWAWIIWAAVTK